MANYLEVIYDVTVSSGNDTATFSDGDLVNPYSTWAKPLLNSGAVADSGLAAPYLGGNSPSPYVANYGQYREIHEVTDDTYDIQNRDLNAELHAVNGTDQFFNIPADVDLRFKAGAFVRIRRMGAGAVTITSDAEVTLFTPLGSTIGAQYQSAYIFKTNDNEWVIVPEGGGANTDNQNASQVPFTPTGNLSATDVQGALAELDTEKETPTGAQTKADAAQTAAENTVAAIYQPISEKGQVSGYAALDGSGKVPTNQLPALAVTDVFVVVDIAARDALTVQEGDVALVQDAGSGDPGSYIYDGTSWQSLSSGVAGSVIASDVTLTPTGNIVSTNVQAGISEA